MTSKKTPTEHITPQSTDLKMTKTAGKDNARDSMSGSSIKPKLSKFSVTLPISIHRRFKVACTLKNVKQVDEVNAIMLKRVLELEKELNILPSDESTK